MEQLRPGGEHTLGVFMSHVKIGGYKHLHGRPQGGAFGGCVRHAVGNSHEIHRTVEHLADNSVLYRRVLGVCLNFV